MGLLETTPSPPPTNATAESETQATSATKAPLGEVSRNVDTIYLDRLDAAELREMLRTRIRNEASTRPNQIGNTSNVTVKQEDGDLEITEVRSCKRRRVSKQKVKKENANVT
jgi:hypothetical protein